MMASLFVWNPFFVGGVVGLPPLSLSGGREDDDDNKSSARHILPIARCNADRSSYARFSSTSWTVSLIPLVVVFAAVVALAADDASWWWWWYDDTAEEDEEESDDDDDTSFRSKFMLMLESHDHARTISCSMSNLQFSSNSNPKGCIRHDGKTGYYYRRRRFFFFLHLLHPHHGGNVQSESMGSWLWWECPTDIWKLSSCEWVDSNFSFIQWYLRY